MTDNSLEKPGTIDAILLASGFSKRFGDGNKLLEPFHGKPLARRTLECVTGIYTDGTPYFERVFFVSAVSEVASLAGDMPDVTSIHNEHPERGLSESIRLGAAASCAAYMMFFPCDQGLLDEKTVRFIADRRLPGRIIRPEYIDGRSGMKSEPVPASPVIFAESFRSALCSVQPGGSGRDIISRYYDDVIRVLVPYAAALRDFDTCEDFASAG